MFSVRKRLPQIHTGIDSGGPMKAVYTKAETILLLSFGFVGGFCVGIAVILSVQ